MIALAQALAELGETVPDPVSRDMLVDWSTTLHEKRLVLVEALQSVDLILSRIEEAQLDDQAVSAIALFAALPVSGPATESGPETAHLLVELLEAVPQNSWRPTCAQVRDTLVAAHECVVTMLRLLGARWAPEDLFEQVDMVAYLLCAYSAQQGAQWTGGSSSVDLPESLLRSLVDLANVLGTKAQAS
jgi:hypothetical protein